jgi:hypothetical protein
VWSISDLGMKETGCLLKRSGLILDDDPILFQLIDSFTPLDLYDANISIVIVNYREEEHSLDSCSTALSFLSER